MEEVQIRSLTHDDIDAALDIQTRSFGPPPLSREELVRRARRVVDEQRGLGAFSGDSLAGCARFWDFDQWWAGHPVRTAGVSGVVVAPEFRGSGVATTVMRAMLDRCRSLGYPLTALYPASLPLYRKLGFEVGGAQFRYTFDAAALRALRDRSGAVAVRRGTAEDAKALTACAADVYARNRASGPLRWPEHALADRIGADGTFCYVADDGFVLYRWKDRDLDVTALVAGSERTARALWSVVGSGSSIARRVHASIAPHDPIHLIVDLEADASATTHRWMLRLLDAPAAIAARGWPPAASVDQSLVIDDTECPDNSGSWILTVEAGTGRLERADTDHADGALRLGARGLAALYAGTPIAALRTAGLAEGGDLGAHDARLDAAFGTPSPYSIEYF